jgi:hypothetical protein
MLAVAGVVDEFSDKIAAHYGDFGTDESDGLASIGFNSDGSYTPKQYASVGFVSVPESLGDLAHADRTVDGRFTNDKAITWTFTNMEVGGTRVSELVFTRRAGLTDSDDDLKLVGSLNVRDLVVVQPDTMIFITSIDVSGFSLTAGDGRTSEGELEDVVQDAIDDRLLRWLAGVAISRGGLKDSVAGLLTDASLAGSLAFESLNVSGVHTSDDMHLRTLQVGETDISVVRISKWDEEAIRERLSTLRAREDDGDLTAEIAFLERAATYFELQRTGEFEKAAALRLELDAGLIAGRFGLIEIGGVAVDGMTVDSIRMSGGEMKDGHLIMDENDPGPDLVVQGIQTENRSDARDEEQRYLDARLAGADLSEAERERLEQVRINLVAEQERDEALQRFLDTLNASEAKLVVTPPGAAEPIDAFRGSSWLSVQSTCVLQQQTIERIQHGTTELDADNPTNPTNFEHCIHKGEYWIDAYGQARGSVGHEHPDAEQQGRALDAAIGQWKGIVTELEEDRERAKSVLAEYDRLGKVFIDLVADYVALAPKAIANPFPDLVEPSTDASALAFDEQRARSASPFAMQTVVAGELAGQQGLQLDRVDVSNITGSVNLSSADSGLALMLGDASRGLDVAITANNQKTTLAGVAGSMVLEDGQQVLSFSIGTLELPAGTQVGSDALGFHAEAGAKASGVRGTLVVDGATSTIQDVHIERFEGTGGLQLRYGDYLFGIHKPFEMALDIDLYTLSGSEVGRVAGQIRDAQIRDAENSDAQIGDGASSGTGFTADVAGGITLTAETLAMSSMRFGSLVDAEGQHRGMNADTLKAQEERPSDEGQNTDTYFTVSDETDADMHSGDDAPTYGPAGYVLSDLEGLKATGMRLVSEAHGMDLAIEKLEGSLGSAEIDFEQTEALEAAGVGAPCRVTVRNVRGRDLLLGAFSYAPPGDDDLVFGWSSAAIPEFEMDLHLLMDFSSASEAQADAALPEFLRDVQIPRMEAKQGGDFTNFSLEMASDQQDIRVALPTARATNLSIAGLFYTYNPAQMGHAFGMTRMLAEDAAGEAAAAVSGVAGLDLSAGFSVGSLELGLDSSEFDGAGSMFAQLSGIEITDAGLQLAAGSAAGGVEGAQVDSDMLDYVQGGNTGWIDFPVNKIDLPGLDIDASLGDAKRVQADGPVSLHQVDLRAKWTTEMVVDSTLGVPLPVTTVEVDRAAVDKVGGKLRIEYFGADNETRGIDAQLGLSGVELTGLQMVGSEVNAGHLEVADLVASGNVDLLGGGAIGASGLWMDMGPGSTLFGAGNLTLEDISASVSGPFGDVFVDIRRAWIPDGMDALLGADFAEVTVPSIELLQDAHVVFWGKAAPELEAADTATGEEGASAIDFDLIDFGQIYDATTVEASVDVDAQLDSVYASSSILVSHGLSELVSGRWTILADNDGLYVSPADSPEIARAPARLDSLFTSVNLGRAMWQWGMSGIQVQSRDAIVELVQGLAQRSLLDPDAIPNTQNHAQLQLWCEAAARRRDYALKHYRQGVGDQAAVPKRPDNLDFVSDPFLLAYWTASEEHDHYASQLDALAFENDDSATDLLTQGGSAVGDLFSSLKLSNLEGSVTIAGINDLLIPPDTLVQLGRMHAPFSAATENEEALATFELGDLAVHHMSPDGVTTSIAVGSSNLAVELMNVLDSSHLIVIDEDLRNETNGVREATLQAGSRIENIEISRSR